MRKKICLLTNWYPTEDNPICGSFFREQALILKEHYDFYVVHYSFIPSNFESRSNVVYIGEEYNIKEYQIEISVPLLWHRLRRYIFRKGYNIESLVQKKFVELFENDISCSIDIFYCVSAQTEATCLKMLADKFNKPYIVSEHAPFPWVGRLISKSNKDAIEQADLLLAISRDKIRQISMQNIKLPSWFLIGNCVDESQFCIKKKSNSNKKTLLFVGASSFYKNYDFFIEVMEKLKLSTKVTFNILVVGYDANRGYCKATEELVAKIQSSIISEIVEMIPFVPREKMQSVYQRADAFIMTSIQEGMPVSALEAACCGLPIFSTRCGGVEDFVTNETGRIFDIYDTENFVEELKKFLEGKMIFDSVAIRKYLIMNYGKEAYINKMVHAVSIAEKNFYNR